MFTTYFVFTVILMIYITNVCTSFCSKQTFNIILDSLYTRQTCTTIQGGSENESEYISQWMFSEKSILRTLPIDKEQRNYVRKVSNAIFSISYPTPLKSSPVLVALSTDVCENLLEFGSFTKSDDFPLFASGSVVLDNSVPLSHRYGGHQFGYWAGQLGDGRVHILGEYVSRNNERWEIQLKGSGKTPYSRSGDGYAAIRSSVREFLCSEAMHYLGIPTSRAATLVISDDKVWRDQFYNGNFKQERAAVVMRVAKSWFRFGSVEILAKYREFDLLRVMLDFIIEHFFKDVDLQDPDRYLALYSQIVEQTAKMISKWQSVGFTHGVCNTDNFSILSITIDYGPFGFLDEYNPDFVPNTSDDEGRYSYKNQPDVGYFNLNKLKDALSPILSESGQRQLQMILKGYHDQYQNSFIHNFSQKLALDKTVGIKELVDIIQLLLHIMQDMEADFTMVFRNLSEWPRECMEMFHIADDLWALQVISKHPKFSVWLNMYLNALSGMHVSDIERLLKMQKINPRYVLRNWIAETAIQHTENGEFGYINKVHDILKRPFQYHEEAEELGLASAPPQWANTIQVSCSS